VPGKKRTGGLTCRRQNHERGFAKGLEQLNSWGDQKEKKKGGLVSLQAEKMLWGRQKGWKILWLGGKSLLRCGEMGQ